MSKLDIYTVIIKEGDKVQKVIKVEAKSHKDAVNKAGVDVRRGSGQVGRPSR